VRQLTDWDEHADFCRTKAGEDALVIAHYRADPNDEVVEFIPLSGTGRRVLWQAPAYNMALHVSCRNTDLPGWVFLSSYWDGIGQRPGLTPFENEVFAMSLDSTQATPVVRRLAHTGMVERADYFDEPHATVSRDGRTVLFGSNFGQFQSSDSYDNVFAIDLADSARTPPAASPVPPEATAPLVEQRVKGSVPKKLRVRRSAVLPRRTNRGSAITWASLSPKSCKVVRGKAVGRAVGKCRIRAASPATGSLRALSLAYRIKITR